MVMRVMGQLSEGHITMVMAWLRVVLFSRLSHIVFFDAYL